MTRRSDLMLEDLTGCDHRPETPIVDAINGEIVYWLCRCGRRHRVTEPDPPPKGESK